MSSATQTTPRTSSTSLSPATRGFVLAASVTVLFNTALAWAKDTYPPLNDILKSVAGHQWTTHGLIDLVLFLALGFVFTRTRAAQKVSAENLTILLIGAVAIAVLGLGLWYVFV